ncbi:MAG: arginine repressor [Tissierellia bacterium]|nr:arginine repressor [Tissierellia bacterium]
MKKHIRQRVILDIINNYEVETQEELLQYLINRGINITQATISRDIKELKLIKVQGTDGKYKYATMDNKSRTIDKRLSEILKYFIISIEKAGNMIVINTISDAAKICAKAIKSNNIEGIIGIIAGEDTIFVAIKDINMVNSVLEEIKNLLK